MPDLDVRLPNKYSYSRSRSEYVQWYGIPPVYAWNAPVETTGTATLWETWDNLRRTRSNPDWKVKIAKQQDASTLYQRRESNFSFGTASLDARLIDNPWGHLMDVRDFITGAYFILPSDLMIPSASIETRVADIALTSLKRKLANRTQSYNVLVPLGELRELRQLIDGAATLATKTVEALRNVRKGRIRSAYKQASDIWLTFSFGISPMMMTIRDINRSIGAYLTRYNSVDRLSGSAKETWTSLHTDSAQSTVFGAALGFRGEAKHILQYKYVCGHKFNLTSANDYSAMEHFGIKPASLVPVLWELTAFSWVVDYFTTAGQFLDDTFTGTTGDSVFIVQNRKYTLDYNGLVMFTPALPGTWKIQRWTSNDGEVKMRHFDFQRTPLTALPSRVLRFRSLDELGFHGVNKLLNLTAVWSKSFRHTA